MADIDDPVARRVALAVAARLRRAGHDAYLCGGAVRDRLLGREPGDYDIATSATPEQVAALFPRAVLVGAQFGVVVVPGAHHAIEVATFRDDGLYVDGRRPTEVRFSCPERDAQRRDFTVNALFEDPETGQILDHVAGLPDLDARLLRAIGDPEARFHEDHLRLLRAVRLAVQLDFAIEPRTFQAVQRLAPTVTTVSAERIRAELLRLLRHGRGAGLRMLRDASLLEHVLPEIHAMQGVIQPALFHPEGDVFVHTCLVLDGLDLEGIEDRAEREDLLLASLLHDVAKPPTWARDETGRIRFFGHDSEGVDLAEAMLTRLRMPRRQIERVGRLIGGHMRIASLPAMRRAKRRRMLGDPEFRMHLRLHAADCGASHGDKSVLRFVEEEKQAWADEPVLPDPLLRGRDLLEMGYAPGPRIGEILAWVRERQLEEDIETREDAVRCVRDRYPPEPSED